MNFSHISSQDIEPEESISQVDYMIDSNSTTASSSAILLTNDPLAAFRAHFISTTNLSDNYLLIENDPVTLAHAKSILKVHQFNITLLNVNREM